MEPQLNSLSTPCRLRVTGQPSHAAMPGLARGVFSHHSALLLQVIGWGASATCFGED